jgi:aryl-alcohol dehydrogenase-like predicted oxidoreductase
MFTRRAMVASAAAVGLGAIRRRVAWQSSAPILKQIPKSGESLPVIGIGTRSFRTGPAESMEQYRSTLAALIAGGGKVIDTAPSYGDSETALGHLLATSPPRDQVFLATKVDRPGRESAVERMDASLKALRTERVDLMQVHNLIDTANVLALIREWKAAGRVRYTGVTTSSPHQYAELERVLSKEPVDFVQLDYALDHREAAGRLLPLAAERGVAVLVNLPFGRGRLFRAVGARPLPPWAEPFAKSWAQLFLKYVVSHPAVTCAIPGMTTREHASDNLAAGHGALPNAADRRRMEEFIAGL